MTQSMHGPVPKTEMWSSVAAMGAQPERMSSAPHRKAQAWPGGQGQADIDAFADRRGLTGPATD